MKITELTEDSVTSSWISDITHDGKNVVMTLKNGNSYTVFDVTVKTFKKWKNSPSKGTFYTKNIKDSYNVQKVG